tara:strand:+ start:1031 stop:1204 length:174 start_codon:yes stop_codon:yes gene_type:complete
MDITQAKYIADDLSNDNTAVVATIDGETICVPINTSNRHYAAILEWVADGNTIQDAD